MEYNKIINPKTNRKVSIYSKLGKKIINEYMNKVQQGGVINDRCNLCGVSIYDADLFQWKNPRDGVWRDTIYLCKSCRDVANKDPLYYDSLIYKILVDAGKCLKDAGCNVMGGAYNK